MPSTLQAVVVFALAFAPGLLFIQGYRRGRTLSRTYTAPDRDFYELAQAVVASLGWLAIVWFCLSLAGNPLKSWGVLPQDADRLEDHRAIVMLLLVALEFLPFAIGIAAGYSVNRLQSSARAHRLFAWTGMFEPATAWDQAWNRAATRASESGQPIELSVRLKSGAIVEGRYGSSSRVDLSPRPGHQLFLETAYALNDSEVPARLLGDGTIGGVFIDSSEIATIHFK